MSITLAQYFGMDPSAFAIETKHDAELKRAIAIYQHDKGRKYEVLTLVYKRNSVFERMDGMRIKHADLVKAGLVTPSNEVVKKQKERTALSLATAFRMDKVAFENDTPYDYDLVEALNRVRSRESELECGECRGCESEAMDELNRRRNEATALVTARNGRIPIITREHLKNAGLIE